MPVYPVTLQTLEQLKIAVGLPDEEFSDLRMAGDVLASQPREIVVVIALGNVEW